MAKPYDITLKHILEAHPADCLQLVGLPTTAPIDVIDADLATVMAEADKVFRIKDWPPWLMHFELQSSYDPDLPQRMLRYNVLLKHRHGLPVHSVVILLRPQADGREMTGVLRETLAGKQYLEFQYRVFRIWQEPVDKVLADGVGTLPLAPLAAVEKSELPAVVQRMKKRFSAEVTPSEEAVFWTETFILMGLRYERNLAHELMKGVREMEDSVTYQEIIRKGEFKEAQRILFITGSDAFGAPDAAAKAAIAALVDRERLEELIRRVRKVKSWQELLGKPPSRQRNGRKRKT
jgi:predicted transposase YdaD